MSDLRLIQMSDIEAQAVDWLWYPYIPFGKITIIQGDPGEGKTMLALTLTALLTTGRLLPEERNMRPPMSVIYQTTEDGLADTIKPRLEKAEADCARVNVIDESESPIFFSDSRIEEAVIRTQARLLILDPLQAYLGAEVDMHRANEVRPAFRRLADMAERTGCAAVVIIGHLNKMSGVKGIYRGLGSIDIPAIARSILFVGRSKEDENVRCMAQQKNSLAPIGKTLLFEIADSLVFTGASEISADKLMSGTGNEYKPTKAANAIEQLELLLSEGAMPASEIYEYFDGLGISEKTVKNAKQELGVVSQKQGSAWVWFLTKEGSR